MFSFFLIDILLELGVQSLPLGQATGTSKALALDSNNKRQLKKLIHRVKGQLNINVLWYLENFFALDFIAFGVFCR